MWRLTIMALLLPAMGTSANRPERQPRAGDVYEISSDRESVDSGSDGSSGSSTDRDTLVERVIGVRDDGLELEYDLPKNSQDRASTWIYPVRVLRPADGPTQLLNRAELESRVDGWLKTGNMTRAACGHWIFTWNAFRIDCDPQSAIKTIAYFDVGQRALTDGTPYQDAAARAPAPLKRTAFKDNGATFVVILEVDPEKLRRSQAEADVTIGEITRKKTTIEDALRTHSGERISGTIVVTLDTDATGHVWRRTTVTTVKTETANGIVKTSVTTHTVQRRLVSTTDKRGQV